MQKIRILNANALKIIAMVTMLIDHFGSVLGPPGYIVFRSIGRIAFPIFAFMIAEGCRYTKNKKMHFALIFSLTTLCQVVYYIADHTLYMSVLAGFSLSILAIYALDYLKKVFLNYGYKVIEKIASSTMFASIIVAIIFFNNTFEIDYGLFGIFIPLCISLTYFNDTKISENKVIKLIDNNVTRVLILAIALIIFVNSDQSLIIKNINVGYFTFITIPLLLLYNGKKGKWNLKYLFYIFYPTHLAALWGLSNIIKF